MCVTTIQPLFIRTISGIWTVYDLSKILRCFEEDTSAYALLVAPFVVQFQVPKLRHAPALELPNQDNFASNPIQHQHSRGRAAVSD